MSSTIKYIAVSDKPLEFLPQDPAMLTLSATDFIANEAAVDLRKNPDIKIINLCGDFDYLSKGYYCSLLAEARGMRCVPSVGNIVTLNWKRHYQAHIPELNALLKKHYKDPPAEPSARGYNIFFGRSNVEAIEPLARQLFDLFRFPLMRLEIKLDAKENWTVDNVESFSVSELSIQQRQDFSAALTYFTGSAWRKKGTKKPRYWVGLLHDPAEASPPSNKGALQRFIAAGKDLNANVELITRQDFSSLMEYDALLIRETTAINHHTYRFAHKAEQEGIPCIDDADSIVRCCNKVFQYEMLESRRIALPRTFIVDKKSVKALEQELDFPAVVKIPDGSFSRGVLKADNPEQFRTASMELLKKSEIILAQEFVPSEFDWRIGILGGEALFACKYYMAEGHWQIYKHSSGTAKYKSGRHETLPVEKVPEAVVKTALKAAKMIGTGFYGVDLKQFGDKIVVMEVNDNPSVDHGIEDAVLGNALYKRILDHLLQQIGL